MVSRAKKRQTPKPNEAKPKSPEIQKQNYKPPAKDHAEIASVKAKQDEPKQKSTEKKQPHAKDTLTTAIFQDRSGKCPGSIRDQSGMCPG